MVDETSLDLVGVIHSSQICIYTNLNSRSVCRAIRRSPRLEQYQSFSCLQEIMSPVRHQAYLYKTCNVNNAQTFCTQTTSPRTIARFTSHPSPSISPPPYNRLNCWGRLNWGCNTLYNKHQLLIGHSQRPGTFIKIETTGQQDVPLIIIVRLLEETLKAHPIYHGLVRLDTPSPCECLKYDLICLRFC